MNRPQMFRSPLNIRSGEGQLVGLMLVYAFFMGIPSLTTETTAYSLFLIEFGAEAVPYVYIGFTVVATTSGYLYTKLEKKISFAKFATVNLIVLTLVLIFFRLLLQFNSSQWPVAALTVWYETGWILANLGFWSLAAHLFNIRQGKRLFGLIGTGFILSESLIGFFVPTLVRLMGTANLLLVAAGSFVCALLVQTYILRKFPLQGTASDNNTGNQVTKQTGSTLSLLKNNYILLIFTMAALYAMLFYALDTVFYDRIESQYISTDQLASFLGIFLAVTGLATVVIGAFVAGPFINRYGIGTGLLTMPVVILAGTASVILVGTAFNALALLFWLVVITKFFNDILAYTVNRASWQVLYDPIPVNKRLRAQTMVESMVQPVAGGLAGVTIILFNSVFGFGTTPIAFMLVVILIIWIGVVIKLNGTYLKVLQNELVQHSLGKKTNLEIDESSVEILKRGLSSSNVGVVVYSLNMLEEIEPDSLPIFLQEMLGNPSPGVRLDALKRIERFELTDVIPAIKFRLKYETSPAVQGYSLRVLAILGGSEMFDEVYNKTSSSQPQVSNGALVGLLRSKKLNPSQMAIAHKKLENLLSSKNPNDRILLARVLGEVNIPALSYSLLTLLKDSNPQVRKEAVIAAGKLKSPEAWPEVIENLGTPTTRAAAIRALVAGGEGAFPAIKNAFVTKRRDRTVLNRLIRICGRIKSKNCANLLKDRLNYPDVQIRTQILVALSQCKYKANEQEVTTILQRVKTEIGQAAWTLAAQDDIGHDENVVHLQDALDKAFVLQRKRILLLLSFVYNTEFILQIQEAFDETGNQDEQTLNKKQGYALELMETLIPQKLKGLLIPLLDDLTPTQRLEQLRQTFPQQKLGRSRRLHDIITRPDAWLDPWTKACALYSVAQLSAVELSETVVFSLTAVDNIVKDTASHTLFKINPQLYAATHTNGKSKHSNNSSISTDCKMQLGDTFMLTLIERVIFLKTVGFFSETPEQVLTELAYILEELEAKPGEVMIEKGEAGSSLYIVVDGQVQVHDGDQIITTLGSKEVFGELSLLDPGPRSASVTATENSRLLRLDQEPFYELIDDHSVVARRIMQILVKNLRNAHKKAQTQQDNDNINNSQKRVINFYQNK